MVIAIAAIQLTTLVQVIVVRFVTPPWTITMVQEAVEERGWPRRRVRSLQALGSRGPRAIVASEDARFFLHSGFDGRAICTSIKDGVTGKRRLRGASTITQQVAKNVFLWQGRSLVRKAMEFWYAFWLERLLPKERILELYLSVAETGPRTFGLEAGARHHFGTSAAELTSSQAGRIAGILPNPDRSIDGKAAWTRAKWIAGHPAPFPGDKGFQMIYDNFHEKGNGLFSCLF
ncbi:MAG: transglycosylase domain-containing protein [Myxococcales bacterium]|nr:transglycosylase domain-containing protein [Myxococcales bacterium]